LQRNQLEMRESYRGLVKTATLRSGYLCSSLLRMTKVMWQKVRVSQSLSLKLGHTDWMTVSNKSTTSWIFVYY